MGDGRNGRGGLVVIDDTGERREFEPAALPVEGQHRNYGLMVKSGPPGGITQMGEIGKDGSESKYS